MDHSIGWIPRIFPFLICSLKIASLGTNKKIISRMNSESFLWIWNIPKFILNMIVLIFGDDYPRDPQFKIYKNLRIQPSYIFFWIFLRKLRLKSTMKNRRNLFYGHIIWTLLWYISWSHLRIRSINLSYRGIIRSGRTYRTRRIVLYNREYRC